MAAHEAQCVRDRLGARQIALETRNAVPQRADPSWLDGFDFLLIGGSGDFSVHHPKSATWVTPLRRVLDRALERALPGLAICFGHQLLGFHLGCPVATVPSHAELGTVDVELTEAGRRCPVFGALGLRFRAHTGHSDHVTGVPEGVDLLAQNEALRTQAFRVRGTRFFSTQFHPDMTGQEGRDRYLAYRQHFTDGDLELALERAASFQPGQDESCALIGRVADYALV
jgi:GMP synthase (glutamine-hydrolysing)